MLKVVIYPYGMDTWGNPYWKILYEHLQVLGFPIINMPLTILNIFRLRKQAGVINYHYYGFGQREMFLFIIKLIIVKFLKFKIVYSVHNLFPREGGKFNFLLFINNLLLIAFSDVLVFHVPAPKILRNKKHVVIPHLNYRSYYPNNTTLFESRVKLDIPQDAFVYLFFGMISPYKGVEALVEAFETMPGQNNFLIIAGPPVDKEYLELIKGAIHNNNILLHNNYVDLDSVQYFFHSANVAVFPFQTISNSGSVILALSFGKPVIAPKKGSLSHIVKPDTGILYSGDSAQALADTMIKARCYKFSDQIEDYIRNVPDPSFVAHQYINLYRQVSTAGL